MEALADLIESGDLFTSNIPAFRPIFFNLRDTPEEKLVNDGGFFGQILWLIRERHAEPAKFERTLEAVVTRLEHMPDTERARWVEFLWYIWALVHQERGEQEQPELREVVQRSVRTDPHRQEYKKMGRTIAEMYMDQGEARGVQKGALATSRAILLRLLRKRFKKVPRSVETRIAATTEMRDLETWLDNIVDAQSLADVGIPLR